jgi:hypothetical protein
MDNSFPLESPSMSRRQLLNFLTGALEHKRNCPLEAYVREYFLTLKN